MKNERVMTGGSLLWKLLAINLPILLLVLIAIWLAIDTLAADYFSEFMERYQISPERTHGMFLDAIHRYLIWTMFGAVVLATVTSYLLTRRVLRPLREMVGVTEKVAAGDYAARTAVRGNDELTRLAESLNTMAASLEDMDKLRKDLIADFAHELRTPLTNVRGYLEALRDGVVKPDQATYQLLDEEIRRLVALSDDLFHLSQADAARRTLTLEPIELVAFIHEAGQLPVAEAAPRNPAYNGGRWFTHTVEWTSDGFMAHGIVPILNSADEVQYHEQLGHLVVTPGSFPDGPPVYFQCPLLPDRG